MRFVCDSCRAQYMISDEKVGPKGVKVRCKKCSHVILVRKTEPDESLDKTTVMDNPLAMIAATEAAAQLGEGEPVATDSTSPKEFLSSVQEDEIGAVFDQVLSSGSTKVAPPTNGAHSSQDDEDEHLSTRVLDPEMMRQLTEAAKEQGLTNADPQSHDWYVAIDDEQVGPIKLDKVKELWGDGKIGPDSLCWRAGLADWQPLSDVRELTAVLAPRPAKPAVVIHKGADVAMAGGGVGTQGAVMAATPGAPEDTGSWKPSAASALASLVKEEIDVLSKPAKPQVERAPVNGFGLLGDLPGTDGGQINGKVNGSHPMPTAHAAPMQMPYAAPHYPPAPQSTSKKWIVLGVLGGTLALATCGGAGVYFLAQQLNRGQMPVVGQPAARATIPSLDGVPPPVAKPSPPVSPPAPRVVPAPKAEPQQPVAHNTPRRSTGNSSSDDLKVLPPSRRVPGSSAHGDDDAITPRNAQTEKGGKAVAEPKGTDDEFEEVFGGGRAPPTQSAKKEPEKVARKTTTYVPPAPGSADIPESLGQSDILEVVRSHVTSIKKCVDEQRQKDPAISGKLVVRWTILTTGKTANVSVRSDEFKSTHMAGCISGLVKGMSFPKHKVQGEPIDFPFTF